jgi:hypothetical protein
MGRMNYTWLQGWYIALDNIAYIQDIPSFETMDELLDVEFPLKSPAKGVNGMGKENYLCILTRHGTVVSTRFVELDGNFLS